MTDSPTAPRAIHLRRGGTSLVLRLDERAFPTALHWGPDLGELTESVTPAQCPTTGGVPAIAASITAAIPTISRSSTSVT